MFARIMDWVRRLFRRECHYINGPETLPPPLTREEEETVMNELRAGDNTHRELLVVRNLRLVVYIAKKFDSCQTATEDLVSIGTIGLMKAVRTFDPNKNIKLATYASRCIENEILMHLRKVSNMKTEMSFDEPLSVDWDGNELTLKRCAGYRAGCGVGAAGGRRRKATAAGDRSALAGERAAADGAAIRFVWRPGTYAKAVGGSNGHFSILYFSAGKAHFI